MSGETGNWSLPVCPQTTVGSDTGQKRCLAAKGSSLRLLLGCLQWPRAHPFASVFSVDWGQPFLLESSGLAVPAPLCVPLAGWSSLVWSAPRRNDGARLSGFETQLLTVGPWASYLPHVPKGPALMLYIVTNCLVGMLWRLNELII